MSIFVHIVTFNSASFIEKCISSLLTQQGFEDKESLEISVTDNASTDGSADLVENKFPKQVQLYRNTTNFGFCAAHNWCLEQFFNSSKDFLLILNPDLKLEKNCLKILSEAAMSDPHGGFATPKLYRADDNLEAMIPKRFDAAGMLLNMSLRHFDRASNELDKGQYDSAQYVFGGTGACLLLKREFVKDMLISDLGYRDNLGCVYSKISPIPDSKLQLFDEAFFAYREDADLAWRAKGTKWKCLYVPKALGYHRRVVLPSNRSELDPFLNRCSVRNRFLLQINNFSVAFDWPAILPGLILRNLLVVLGVVLRERSSVEALRQVHVLFKRALNIRKQNMERRRLPRQLT